MGAATAVLPLFMTGKVESPAAAPAFGSFRPLAGLAALFALDSLGAGFVANAVIAYWLHVRFGADAATLGPVFAGIPVLQPLSYEGSCPPSTPSRLITPMAFTPPPRT